MNRRIIKSYSNVWKIEFKIYNIGGFSITPISASFLIYYGITMLFSITIGWWLPGFIKFIILPLICAYILDHKQIDGKNPFQFLRSMTIYYFTILTKGHKVNRFKYYKPKKVGIKSKISYRVHRKK